MRECAGLAVFDLDGTLTKRDTLIPYLAGFLLKHPSRLVRLPRLLAASAAYGTGRMSNAALKEAFLSAVLGGITRDVLQSWTQTFTERLIVNGFRRDAVQTLCWHRASGHYIVILSASVDLYVRPLGQLLGVDEVVCTEVEWQDERLTGRLATPNCAGDEKVRRLEMLMERLPSRSVWAYADRRSDLPLLQRATHAYLVNSSRWARTLAGQCHVQTVTWQ